MSVSVLVIVLWAMPLSMAKPPALSWTNQSRAEHYQAPSAEQLATAETLWSDLWRDQAMTAAQRSAWSSLGFEVVRFDGGFAFRDPIALPRGWGSYLVRVGGRPARSAIMLQAPHRYYDSRTGPIAYRWWRNDDAVTALALNSTPRANIDLAAAEASMLLAFTRAFVAQYSTGQVIQVHGFAAAKRASKEARESELILSASRPKPGRRLRRVTRCLRNAGFAARLYPTQVQELGGTRNVVAQLLRELDAGQFVHLEISAELRASLVDKPGSLAKVTACF